MEEEKKSLVNWIKEHKRTLITAGISVAFLIGVALGLKHKDSILTLWCQLQELINTPKLYSPKWFETVSDADLELERENVRLAYCSSGDNFSEACVLQNLLRRFDREMSKRAWGGEIPHAPSIHREHGWYLPNDD